MPSKKPVAAPTAEVPDKTKNNRIKYGDIKFVKVRAKFTRPFMGGEPTGQDDPMQALYREGNTYVIPGRNLRAMLRDGSKFIDRSGTETKSISTQRAPIFLKGAKVERITNLPILSATGGKGILNAEVIGKGAEFEVTFAVPTKAISLADFQKLLYACGKWIGVGAYRKGDFGLFDVISIKEITESL